MSNRISFGHPLVSTGSPVELLYRTSPRAEDLAECFSPFGTTFFKKLLSKPLTLDQARAWVLDRLRHPWGLHYRPNSPATLFYESTRTLFNGWFFQSSIIISVFITAIYFKKWQKFMQTNIEGHFQIGRWIRPVSMSLLSFRATAVFKDSNNLQFLYSALSTVYNSLHDH